MEIDITKNIWYSPCYAIYNFKQLVQQIGIEKAFKKKKELEAYITGIALLGIRYYEGRVWWLQMPDEDPPDVLTMTPSINSKHIGIKNIQLVEVYRIEDSKKEVIQDTIRRKLKDKVYDASTSLIGLINRDEEVKDLRDFKEQINNLKPNISSVWLVGNLDPLQNNYMVAQLWPETKPYKINIDEECKFLRKFGQILRTTRSLKEARAKRFHIRKSEIPKLIPGGSY